MTTDYKPSLPFPPRRASECLRDELIAHLKKTRPPAGTKFFSDHDLVRITKLSRPTVRRSLDALVKDGWIERRHGVGTFAGPRLGAPIKNADRSSLVRIGRVAVLVHFIGKEFAFDWQTAGVLDGLDELAAECGLGIEVMGVRETAPDAVARRLNQTRPNVLACISPRLDHAAVIAEARRNGIPVLLTGSRLSGMGFPTVREDGAQGAALAVRHLIERGHRRIALALPTAPAAWVFERRSGYLRALAEAAMPIDENLVLWTGEEDGDPCQRVVEFLDRQKPTAMLFGSGSVYARLRPSMNSGQVKIPQDLSVVTFDQMWGKLPWQPRLMPTVIALPLRRMGQALAKMARQILDGETPQPPPPIPCELVEGETVTPLAAA